ncbi:hypothetical protein [Sinomonas atrocyanea]
MKNLVDEALDVLAYSLGPLLPATARVESIQHNSQFAQAAATADLMVVVAFTVRVGESATAVTVAIPADALLPQLGAVNPVASAEDAPSWCAASSPRSPSRSPSGSPRRPSPPSRSSPSPSATPSRCRTTSASRST